MTDTVGADADGVEPAWRPRPQATGGEAPDATRMDTVELLVRDLDTMTGFYERAVTLEVLDQSGPTATLGRGGIASVVLRQRDDLPGWDPHGAGLYHTAIVFEDETRLATALQSMAQRAGTLYEGSGEHHVSQAFYFRDPEGNGLELYRDRPREQWPIRPDGAPRMGTGYLDPNRFLAEWYDPEASVRGASAVIGHVHLQAGDIPAARRFYGDVLGFDVVLDLGTALFVSAGGYHHHIGINTWHSSGAGPRAASLGLGDVRIRMPHRADVEALADRLRYAAVASSDDGATIRFADPWGTTIAVAADDAR